MQMPDNVHNCIHCNKCVKKCSFLTKYNIDLEAFSKREDLAYHCFLCNDCKNDMENEMKTVSSDDAVHLD